MTNKNDIVVFTAVFDDYDVLLDPKRPSEDVDYICFTDGSSSIDSEVWEERKISFEEDLPPNMKNRKIKILPHLFLPDYEYSVYIDTNIGINGNIKTLVKKYLATNKLAVLKHRYRDGIYQEAEAVIEFSKADPEKVQKQIKRYREEGLPEKNGLSENRILLRRHNNPEIIDMMEEWWKEMQKGSQRDQLSLSYILWKNNYQPTYMEEYPYQNKGRCFFSIHPHKPDGWKGEIFEYWIPLSFWLEPKTGFHYPMKALRILINNGLKELFKAIGGSTKEQ